MYNQAKLVCEYSWDFVYNNNKKACQLVRKHIVVDVQKETQVSKETE